MPANDAVTDTLRLKVEGSFRHIVASTTKVTPNTLDVTRIALPNEKIRFLSLPCNFLLVSPVRLTHIIEKKTNNMQKNGRNTPRTPVGRTATVEFPAEIEIAK